MDQARYYERELGSGSAVKTLRVDEGKVSSWTTKLTIVTLQVIIAVSIFQVFKDWVFTNKGPGSSNIYLGIMGCTLATICAYLILVKYQSLIQQFSRENVKLGERLGARTAELEQANEEMRQEIAERRRVEEALLESESRFRTIIREAAIGIALLDQKGRLIESNPALQTMLGYSPEELRGMGFSQIQHPENSKLSQEIFRQLLAGEQEVYRVETRYTRKDGWVGWGRQSISLVREAGGEAQFAIAMFEDITERRENEERIRTYQEQLQSLASELSLTEERERRRLATVLHDHIAQLLVLAKDKFEKMQESSVVRALIKPMEEVRRLIEESIRYTRALIFELSPPILYDLGFEATMEWLAEHMEEQYGLKVEVENDDLPKPLDNEARVLLFRGVRELLFNVLKHAQTKSAKVRLRGEEGQLRVIVEDNGVGFAPDRLISATGKVKGFGLFSVRERLNYFGGSLEVESIPGEVTRVSLVMPLQSKGKPKKSRTKTAVPAELASPSAASRGSNLGRKKRGPATAAP